MSRLIALLLLLALPTAAPAHDPTRPPPEARTEAPAPQTADRPAERLTSILHGRAVSGPARARIDGTWLRAGEEHDGLRVLRIERRRVLIRENGERRELTLNDPAAVKRPATGPDRD